MPHVMQSKRSKYVVPCIRLWLRNVSGLFPASIARFWRVAIFRAQSRLGAMHRMPSSDFALSDMPRHWAAAQGSVRAAIRQGSQSEPGSTDRSWRYPGHSEPPVSRLSGTHQCKEGAMPYVTDAELVEIMPDFRTLAAVEAPAAVREPTMLSSDLPCAKTTADNRCPCCGGIGRCHRT